MMQDSIKMEWRWKRHGFLSERGVCRTLVRLKTASILQLCGVRELTTRCLAEQGEWESMRRNLNPVFEDESADDLRQVSLEMIVSKDGEAHDLSIEDLRMLCKFCM